MTRLILGLPHLSQGALYKSALKLGAPVMISASCLARWSTIEHRGDRTREWRSWNPGALDRSVGSGLEIHLDSAGFVAMALRGGYDWSPESYITQLVAHPAVTRASSMDLCVEREVASSRIAIEERIAKTINLNHRCHQVACDLGIENKLMPVIQGDTADDYLRCFDAIEHLVPKNGTIGVGSMCRRPTNGPTGAVSIVEILHDRLPRNVTLHLFGVKSDAAEACTAFDGRVSSVDSQSYGTRARMLAGELRKQEPGFSKTDAFVAGVMESWYLKQSERLRHPSHSAFQKEMNIAAASTQRQITVIDAVENLVRCEFNDLIASGELDHDHYVGGRMLEEAVMERLSDLPDNVRPTDLYTGAWQIPEPCF